MKSCNCLVSVVIPLFNKEKSIASTLDSVANQTYQFLDIVVVNDGSTDNSLDIVKQKCDSRFRVISQENRGVSFARNRGVIEAYGEWIMFLDADDILFPNAIQTLVERSNCKCDLIVGNFMATTIDGEGSYLPCKNVKKGFVSRNKACLYMTTNRLPARTGSYIIKKDIVIKCPFRGDLKRYEDGEAFFNWIKFSDIFIIDTVVMSYHTEFSSLSIVNQDRWASDYGFYLVFKGESFYNKLYLGLLLKMTYEAYPTYVKQLNEKYGINRIYSLLASLFIFKQRVINKFLRLFHG